jgi:ABC-2 type transport system permease protein
MTIAPIPEPAMPASSISGPPAPDVEPVRLPVGLDLSALLTVVKITVSRQNRGIRLWVLAILFAMPIVLAILIRRYQVHYRPSPVEDALVLGLIFPVLVPLAALLLASGMVQDDVEEQTLTYLLIRPIRRWAIYLAKLIGTIVSSWVRAAIFTVGTLVAIHWGDERLVGVVLRERAVIVVGLLALALAAYAAIFGWLSLVVRRALVIGAIYIVVVEGLLGSIPFVVRELTVVYYIRVLSVRWLGIPGVDWSIDPKDAVSASTCVIVLASIAAAFTALGAFTFRTREFRVKTPEGN